MRADSSLLADRARRRRRARRTAFDLTRLRLEGGIAPRTDLDQAEQILAQAEADLAQQTHGRRAGRQRAAAAGWQRRSPRPCCPARSTTPCPTDRASCRPASTPTSCFAARTCFRPNTSCAPPTPNIGAARAALFPRITLTGLLGLASTALGSLFTGGAFGWQAPVQMRRYTHLSGRGRPRPTSV